jgi:hypothetical protein
MLMRPDQKEKTAEAVVIDEVSPAEAILTGVVPAEEASAEAGVKTRT